MNPEYNTLIQWSISVLGLASSSILYALGGLAGAGKFYRRFLGSFILACAVNAVCLMRGIWSPWFLLVYPFTCIAWSLPYGADNTLTKVIKRSVFALASCACGLIFCIKFGGNAWWVLIPHCGVGAWSIFMGVKNPIESTAEQGAICIMLSLGLIMYPFAA